MEYVLDHDEYQREAGITPEAYTTLERGEHDGITVELREIGRTVPPQSDSGIDVFYYHVALSTDSGTLTLPMYGREYRDINEEEHPSLWGAVEMTLSDVLMGYQISEPELPADYSDDREAQLRALYGVEEIAEEWQIEEPAEALRVYWIVSELAREAHEAGISYEDAAELLDAATEKQ